MFSFILAFPYLRCEAYSETDSVISEAQMRQYNALYLEAVCQREQNNDVAQYHLLKRALEINPCGADAYFDLATLAMGKGLNEVPVTEYLELAHKYAPANEDYAYMCAVALMSEAERREEGVALMNTLLDNARVRNDAFETLTEYYEGAGDYDGLVEVLEKWRPIKGDDVAISYHKVKAACDMQRYDDALLIVDTLISLSSAGSDVFCVLKGQIYAEIGDVDKALELYNEVVARNPNLPEAQFLYLSYSFAIDNDSIKRAAFYAITTNPEQEMRTRTEAYAEYMKTFKASEKPQAIKLLLGHLLQQNEENPYLLTAIVRDMTEENMPDSLLAPVYKKILEINPTDESTRLMLIIELGRDSQYEEIKQWCMDGIKLNPEQYFFYYFLANTYILEDKTDEALKTMVDGLVNIHEDTDPVHASLYYALYADCLHKHGDQEKAYENYEIALQYNNTNATCLNNYAYFLSLNKTKLDKAETMAQKAITLEPTSSTFLDTYAWVMFVKKNYAKAAQYIEKAMKCLEGDDNEHDGSLYEHAGDIYYHLGQKDKAMKFWRKAASLSPESKLLQKKVAAGKYFEE